MPTLRLPALAILVFPFLACGPAGEISAAPALQADAGSPLALIPYPEHVARNKGVFALTAQIPVSCAQAADAVCNWTADYLIALIGKTRGLALQRDNSRTGIVFRRTSDVKGRESYRLVVSTDGVQIAASSDAGLLYGAITLWQLASQQAGRAQRIEIPAVDIADAPRFAWRGVLLDSARHFQPPAFVKSFIDAMALHKLNVLQWHLADDQGWRLAIKRYPRLTSVGAWRTNKREGRYGGFYTQNQVREIVAYARQRGITIVPEIEMPGHARAAIVSYPKLGSGRRTPKSILADWGVFHDLYNVNDSTFAFLENVLTEVMELFPGRYIHVGGDEVPKDEWNASPAIQHRMRQLHIKDTNALQGYFTDRIGKFLEAHGRHLIGWDEILDGAPPPSAAVTSWRTLASAGQAADDGHDVVLSPAPQLYLDYCQSLYPDAHTCRGMQTTLHDVYTFDPAPEGALASHLLGIQANIWTEHMPTPQSVSYAAFPRLAAVSEIAWSPRTVHDWHGFLQRLPAMFDRYSALGITASDAAFHVAITATPAPGGAVISLSSQADYGEIHYTTDGTRPTASSPVFDNPVAVRPPSRTTRSSQRRPAKILLQHPCCGAIPTRSISAPTICLWRRKEPAAPW
jgi:hexosaminidase